MTEDEFQAEEPAEYTSPACSMHQVDPSYMGVQVTDSLSKEIATWRTTERERLFALRIAATNAERVSFVFAISNVLDEILGDIAGKSVAAYWPFLGEPDLRGWMPATAAAGGVRLLPVIVAMKEPLEFRPWNIGEKLHRGLWNIPVPVAGKSIRPDIVIAPLVGFDSACYRLGYGGGFFDRTIAAFTPTPVIIGVGYSFQKLPTIKPHVHDIPMDVIVTENGAFRRVPDCRPHPR
ncbi:5-formyltetrahydrofolate cyclo-ligase [Rhizobium sp. HT1-10]|uniref:5-formyltetrahydrofolate cyclo-ligase n=1 Tax=Rhizobium sp. HT1-10 TaxID=3111638 RepID=UPI003C269AD4